MYVVHLFFTYVHDTTRVFAFAHAAHTHVSFKFWVICTVCAYPITFTVYRFLAMTQDGRITYFITTLMCSDGSGHNTVEFQGFLFKFSGSILQSCSIFCCQKF